MQMPRAHETKNIAKNGEYFLRKMQLISFQEMCKLFEKLQTGSNIEYHCSCHCFYIGMFASNSNTELITLPEDL